MPKSNKIKEEASELMPPRASAIQSRQKTANLVAPGRYLDSQTSETQFFGDGIGEGIAGEVEYSVQLHDNGDVEGNFNDNSSELGPGDFTSTYHGGQIIPEIAVDDESDASTASPLSFKHAGHATTSSLGGAFPSSPARQRPHTPVKTENTIHSPFRARQTTAPFTTPRRRDAASHLADRSGQSTPTSPVPKRMRPSADWPQITPRVTAPNVTSQLFWKALDEHLRNPPYSHGAPADQWPMLRSIVGAMENAEASGVFTVPAGPTFQDQAVREFYAEFRRIGYEHAGMTLDQRGNPVQQEMLALLHELARLIPCMSTATMCLNIDTQKEYLQVLRGITEAIGTLVKVDSHARKDLSRTTYSNPYN
ncbi:hypothetical protein EIP91_004345 [Steccherinum ochraceum]|uniref:Uncharacterized protein n=1 Tax=Steccherinum ochraceum TaxID=92696 RepID=A0A4R0RC19_9APHY|nr:hypothetical protein EIP91_004345 [Steccherinum ochraceum]